VNTGTRNEALEAAWRVICQAMGGRGRYTAAGSLNVIPYMIIQAMVLESELLAETIVNDPVPREETQGVPTVPEGPTLVR
jgi:hypothetical protein